MPPWFADPQYGPYLNDRSLSQRDIETIARWVDAGAPEGDASDAPAAVQWPRGWFIEPDIIVDGPVTDVPARTKNDVVEWITVIMPSGFTKDTWVTSVQIKPEFPEVTHHLCIGYILCLPETPYALRRLRLRAFFDSLQSCRPSSFRCYARFGSRSSHAPRCTWKSSRSDTNWPS